MFNQYNLRAVTSRQEVVYVTNNIVHTLMSYYKGMQKHFLGDAMLHNNYRHNSSSKKIIMLLIKYREILIIITEKLSMVNHCNHCFSRALSLYLKVIVHQNILENLSSPKTLHRVQHRINITEWCILCIEMVSMLYR